MPQVFGVTSLRVYTHVHPCRAHACAVLAWEQRVMTPVGRWCANHCNVCARRRCQHHRPLSWPGFLTQRFLSQLIGPDTNFLAELQCGPSNLITSPPPPFTQLLWLSQPLVISVPSHRRLMSSFSVASDWAMQALSPASPKLIKPVIDQFSKDWPLKGLCKSCGRGNPAHAVKF